MVKVRRLRTDDVEVCARIVAGDPLWRRYGLTLPRARRAFRWALAQARRGRTTARAAGEVAVAAEGHHVLGFIWFHLDGTFYHSGYVRWIGVAPQARGLGVGRRLMAYAEERILRSGPNVFLLVSDFNRRAQTFYRRQGYAKIGAIPDYVVPGITEHLFRKTRGPVAEARGEPRAPARRDARARRGRIQ
jgi:ribosomal protein S18 acetylase RimI-like enzyme